MIAYLLEGLEMSDQDLLLEEHLRLLRLPSFLGSYQRVADAASRGNRSYTEFLAILAEEEVLRRQENAIQRRIKAAKFPLIKTLDAFDFAAQPSLNKKEILQLAECHFLAEKTNLIFVGPCGTGKTHLSVALGFKACSKGYKVFFDTAAGLINSLLEAKNEYRFAKKLKQLSSFDLIICDELGYIPFDRQGTDLLFQLVAARYEKGSMMITTNLPFSDWSNIFHDSATAAAVIDRLVHHSVIVQMKGDSFRLASKVTDSQ
jgi:DNA replication protein DnaC